MRWILKRLGLYAWTQNLKADGGGRSWFHRRGWVKSYDDHPSASRRSLRGAHWEFVVAGSLRLWGLDLATGRGDSDSEIRLGLYCWPLMLWLGLDTGRRRKQREWRATLGVEMLHLQFAWGVDPWMYPSRTGWEWSCFLPDLLFGRARHSSESLEERPCVVPMPEGNYPARCKLTRDTWKRPRWPFAKARRYAELEVEGGIPHPGKGENSWDCDDDATYSISCEGDSVRAAVEKMRQSVMRSRERYGGPGWVPRDGWKARA